MAGTVVSMCICPIAGAPMQHVYEATAIEGQGLKGDRYCVGEGSFNQGKVGDRQVTIMNAKFFADTRHSFRYADSRRNIFTLGVEVMDLIGNDFRIGEVWLHGVKYAYTCGRPSMLCGKPGFDDVFHDLGGIVAQITKGGIIHMGDTVIPPERKKIQTT